jgi:hypothetical protein
MEGSDTLAMVFSSFPAPYYAAGDLGCWSVSRMKIATDRGLLQQSD